MQLLLNYDQLNAGAHFFLTKVAVDFSVPYQMGPGYHRNVFPSLFFLEFCRSADYLRLVFKALEDK